MKSVKLVGAALLAILLIVSVIPIPVKAVVVDPSKPASITIHKYQVDGSKTLSRVQDGEEITDLDNWYVYEGERRTTLGDLKGLDGVAFTVTRVEDDTKRVEGAKPYVGNGAYTKTVTTATVNGQTGIARFENLPHGIYLVEEGDVKDHIPDTGKFLLELPMTNPSGNGFLYDVHVYPKNIQDRSNDLAKTVKEWKGGEAVWEFAWEIPADIGDGKKLALTDDLDSQLSYKGLKVTCTSRSGSERTMDKKLYQVKYDKNNNTVTITFEDEKAFQELAKALKPESGSSVPKLLVEITTVAKAEARGTIYNSGELVFEDKFDGVISFRPLEDPSIDMDERTGSILIYKYDGNTQEPLEGAEFQLYETKEDALRGINPIENPESRDGSWPPTQPDGYLLMDGLEYEGNSTTYWLVETKAPEVDGREYNIITTPIGVRVGRSSHLKSNRVEVANNTGPVIPRPGGGESKAEEIGDEGDKDIIAKVPKSGGRGMLPNLLLGSALLGTAGILAYYRKRHL